MSTPDLTIETPSPRIAGRAWRREMGPMPVAVRDVLIRSSREDLGTAWWRIDAACARANGERRWSYNARDFLMGEGLTMEEAALVVAWIWPAPVSA